MTTRAELEAQIEAAPTDDAAFLILGDWLQLQGDPRGELIALDAAAASPASMHAQRAELLARHPELAPLPGPRATLTWHLGFVRRIVLDSEDGLLDLLVHPAFRFLTEVVCRSPEHEKFRDWLAELARRVPLLRTLAIGNPEEQFYRWSAAGVLDLDALVPQLAQLEHLFSSEPFTFAAAPRLRSLIVRGDAEAMRRIERTALPAVERLGFRQRDTTSVQLADLRWLLDAPPPALSVLELELVPAGDIVRALVSSKLLPQLRRLRLWNAGITPEVARLFTRQAFGHLELLDLSDPLLTDETVALVRDVCPDVRTISPWMREILRRPE